MQLNPTASANKIVFPRLLRRVRASLIDSVIYILVVVLWWIVLPYLQVLPGGARIALPLVVWLILDSVMVTTTGGTIGHHLMNIKIVDARTLDCIGLFRAMVRSFLKTILGWLSLVFILVTKKHQAVHDLLVHSTVVLSNPEKVPASEQRTEQTPDENYTYPTIWYRALVIILYLFVLLVAIGIAGHLVASTECMTNSRCTSAEKSMQSILGIFYLVAAAVIFVCGCRGQLSGARKRPVKK